ncbi:hypothetical protein AA18890_0162 [Komagataeibacter europaeus LMG 18890]|nr:hypothetical protein AA18890_0162 [Komagataeibacter europaeus LMG 18890]
MGTELTIALRIEIFATAPTAALTRFPEIFGIEDDLNGTSHASLPYRLPRWPDGQATG